MKPVSFMHASELCPMMKNIIMHASELCPMMKNINSGELCYFILTEEYAAAR
jgi:hypothetical protein